MPTSVIEFEGQKTLNLTLSPGDYAVWVRWKNICSSQSDISILDFWEMREGDAVSITNNIEELPPWFELHPTEVSGFRACLMMQKKLDTGYKPQQPVGGPNLWRVMTGDRLLWISGSKLQNRNPVQALIVFKNNALVFGERFLHRDDVGWALSFGAPLEESRLC